MTGNVNPQGTITVEASAAEQLDEHLAGLPRSRQRAHTGLGILMLACGLASVGLMIWAIVVSVRANTFGVEYVPFWWFIWAAVVCLFLVLYGLSSVVGRAAPPFAIGRGDERMKFGHQAQRDGWLTALGGLLGVLVFTGLAIYVGVTGTNLLEQFITGVVGFFAGLGLLAIIVNIGRAIVGALRKS